MWERNKRTIFVMLTVLLAAYPIAWAASNLFNPSYSPAEWYQQPSLFFRSLTNPPQIIPVMASDGYRLPVDLGGGISITIGSTTFTAAPVFSDAGGTGTLALVDSSRRPIIVPGAYTTASYTNITLTPNVAYSIPLMTGVDSLTIQNTATSGEFWTGLKTATVSISTGLKAFSLVQLEHVDLTTISIIASTALPISITQLGY